MNEKTRSVIERIVIPALLTLALVVVSIWGVAQSSRAETYRMSAESMYKRAFNELIDSFSSLETTLSKLQVVNSTAQYTLLLDDVWRTSGAAVSQMAQIPSYHVDTVELNSFVVRVGDYAHALTRKAVRGERMSLDDAEQLNALRERCAELSAELVARLEAGDVPIAVITNEDYYTSESGEYEDTEGINEFPTLIYDGPFSQSAEKQTARGLTGSDIDAEEARSIAEAAAGTPLSFSGESNGVIPAYDFSGELDDGRAVDVSITKQGGRVLWLMSSSTGDGSGVPEQSESSRYLEAAKSYVSDAGYGEMRGTYAQYYGGAALINMAAVQDGVILYNDLVKIWVDRETLEIIGVDARNYLFSHIERELETPRFTLDEARTFVSDNLEIEGEATALIPVSPERETLCYEFKGTFSDDSYIVYINALTGAEEQIFRIIDTADGQLTL